MYEVLRVVMFIETESKRARGGAVGTQCLVGTEFQFGKTKILEMILTMAA